MPPETKYQYQVKAALFDNCKHPDVRTKGVGRLIYPATGLENKVIMAQI